MVPVQGAMRSIVSAHLRLIASTYVLEYILLCKLIMVDDKSMGLFQGEIMSVAFKLTTQHPKRPRPHVLSRMFGSEERINGPLSWGKIISSTRT